MSLMPICSLAFFTDVRFTVPWSVAIYLNVDRNFFPFLPHLRPCMMVGPTGTGKSCYVQDKMMNELDREKYLAFFMAFSAQSTAMQTQVMAGENIQR